MFRFGVFALVKRMIKHLIYRRCLGKGCIWYNEWLASDEDLGRPCNVCSRECARYESRWS